MSGLGSVLQFHGDLDRGYQGRLAEVFSDLAVMVLLIIRAVRWMLVNVGC